MKSTVRICAAIFLTIISIHLLPVFHGDLPEAFALSVEEERVLGQEFMAKIRKQFNVVDDDFANEYINDLGQYLITPLEIQYFPFRFFVIRDNRFNAFAAPGGNIFVFSGLIEAMERVDELAAVLCHEIAHVSARHLAERIEQSKKIGLASMAGVLAVPSSEARPAARQPPALWLPASRRSCTTAATMNARRISWGSSTWT